MGGFAWTAEEDEILRQMAAAGEPHADIVKALGGRRSIDSVRSRAYNIGAVMPPELAKRNSARGAAAAMADPAREAERIRKISARFTPERRARQSEVAKAVNARRAYGPAPTPEKRAALAKGLVAYNRRHLTWLPDSRREQYRHLVRHKRLTAEEAKQVILADIAAEKARLTPFERQMAALRNGGTLVEKPRLTAKTYDFTLGGVSPL